MSFKSVFIGGLDRSGKTYMRFILESHPAIIFSKRTSLWPRYYKKFGSLEMEDNLDNLLVALSKNKHVSVLNLDFQHLKITFQRGVYSYERIFELIHQQFAEKNGRNYWGDQTEFLERYAWLILNAYPHAKFIHMIRDPRDRFAAIRKKSKNRQGLGIATARWLISAKLAKRNQFAFPNRYQVVRYETMVSQPEKTALDICEFLGLAYEPSMFLLEKIPRFKEDNKRENKNNSPITSQFVGQFTSQLFQSQIAFIEKFSQNYMNEFQYARDTSSNPNRVMIGEYLKTWPINILEMLGWKLIAQEGRV